MSPFRYWPPLGHLALILAVVAIAYLRVDYKPAQTHVAKEELQISISQTFKGRPNITLATTERSGDVETVAARPLFSPTRRPELSSGQNFREEQITETTPDVAMRMVGYIKRDQNSFAVIETIADGATHVVQSGDMIQGMTVREVNPDSVLMDLGGKLKNVTLFAVSPP